jgi:hypothetical protein
MHDGRINTSQFEKNEVKFNLHPSNEEVEKVISVMLHPVLEYVKEVE